MDKIRFCFVVLAVVLTSYCGMAYGRLDFHCDSDTVVINGLLKSPELAGMDKNDRVAFFARKLVGSPSDLRQQVLEADTVSLTVNIHTFNPLSLLSTCVALSQAYATSSAPNWRDFAEKYESLMFKGGKAGDFISRFLYSSDWIADNIFRENIIDATQRVEGVNVRKKEKSIDYISHHKDALKALSDPRNLERLKMLEMGFRNHQIIYIPNGDLTNPSRYRRIAMNGDMVFLLTTDFNLDSREMGIICKEGDDIWFIQVSQPQDKVVMEALPFEQYVKRNIKRIQGARVMRIK